MEKLLQWSIANQSEDKEVRDKIGAPDPEQLARLFGASADEPTLMKQNMEVITNDEYKLEDKEIAFDNFEMLIENLDNANNIENLKLWEPLINQLDNKNSNSLITLTCSVIGTAVQNNPDSQNNCLKYEPMARLISIASTKNESQLKALYALSSLIRHNELGYKQFNDNKGWDIISHIFNNENNGDDDKAKLRTLSLLSSILSTGIDDLKKQKIEDEKIIINILNSLNSNNENNINSIDKVLNLLTQLASSKYKFTDEEVNKISKLVNDIEPFKDQLNEDDFQTIKSVSKY